MIEPHRDTAELDALCSAFAATVPGHERAVVAFTRAVIAAQNRRALTELARQLRAGGLHAEVDGTAIVLDLGTPQKAPSLERLFTAMLSLFRNRRHRSAIRPARP